LDFFQSAEVTVYIYILEMQYGTHLSLDILILYNNRIYLV